MAFDYITPGATLVVDYGSSILTTRKSEVTVARLTKTLAVMTNGERYYLHNGARVGDSNRLYWAQIDGLATTKEA